MTKASRPFGSILIASERPAEAALVKTLLNNEFSVVVIADHPDQIAPTFDRLQPDVLVLAFETLEKSERHNLGLYRQSQEIHLRPHRTIALCNEAEVTRAYELCRDEIFDDYILFWPLTRDAPCLLMAVHHALRELAGSREGGIGPMELAAQVRSLTDLEPILEHGMERGGQHIEATDRAIAQAGSDIGKAISGFTRRLAEGDLAGSLQAGKARERNVSTPMRQIAA
ncbi:MAG: hypothetical protein ABSH53_24550 [Holophaga sp.]